MFAAKHLPPHYVKSIPLRADLIAPEHAVEIMEQDTDMQHYFYDSVDDSDFDATKFLLQRLSQEPTPPSDV